MELKINDELNGKLALYPVDIQQGLHKEAHVFEYTTSASNLRS